MFENNIVEKRVLRRKMIMEELEKAKEENPDSWKVKQLEARLRRFNERYYPEKFWDSNEKGTYIKEDKENEEEEK